MNQLAQKSHQQLRRQKRTRASITSSADRPRMSVRVTNLHIHIQIIDDTSGKTLVAVTTVGAKEATGTMTQKAAWAGQEVAKKAKQAKIKTVVFDRGPKLYHGRVKALADAAREGGLEF